MVLPPIVEKELSKVSLHVVGPLRTTARGNRLILTVVDHSTKWTESYAIPDHQAITIATKFSDFISHYGVPDSILHDLGTDFYSKLFEVYLINFYGITQLKCSILHPQSNTAYERMHHT